MDTSEAPTNDSCQLLDVKTSTETTVCSDAALEGTSKQDNVEAELETPSSVLSVLDTDKQPGGENDDLTPGTVLVAHRSITDDGNNPADKPPTEEITIKDDGDDKMEIDQIMSSQNDITDTAEPNTDKPSTENTADSSMEIVSGEDKPAAKTESKLLPPMEKSFVIPLASPKIPSLGTDSNRGKNSQVSNKDVLPTILPPPPLPPHPTPPTESPKQEANENSVGNLNKLLASTKSLSFALAKPNVNIEGILQNNNKDHKRKLHNGCSNANCTSNSDELVIAKKAAILYFRFNTSYKKVHKICKICNEEAESFLKNSVGALKNDENIFTFISKPQGMEGDVIEVKDDEEEDNPADVQRLEAENKEIFELAMSVEDLIGDLMTKLDLKSQITKCEQTTTIESANLEKDYSGLEKQIAFVERQVVETKKIYDKVTGYYQPVPVITEEIDISTTGTIVKSVPHNDHLQNIPNLPDLPPGVFQPNASPAPTRGGYRNRPRKAKENRTRYSDDGDIIEVVSGEGSQKITCPLGRPPKEIPKLVPPVGGNVYAQNRTLLHFWVKTSIEEIVNVGSGKSPEFVVKFERKQGVGGGGLKRVTAKQIAYNIPCPFILIVGTRIIAKFRDELKMEPIGDGQYYAGIVAEHPTPQNKFRYLIFFDDGYAQYVGIKDILLIYEYSKEVWSDVHPDSAEFIKSYLTKYPERPMVRLTLGQVVTTEWNGKWWVARVTELDCSLVKMQFENDGRCEWIYRGSTRLSPLFEKQTRQRQKKTARRTTSAPIYNKNHARIEYNYGDDDDLVPSHGRNKPLKPTARKSTSGAHHALEKQYGDIRRLARLDYGEFEGTIIKRPIPSDVPFTKEYGHHVCNSSCVYEYDDSNKEYKKMSPLALPLHLGFTREIAKNPRRSIFYRGPCGIRIRDMEEMYDYLTQTQCQVPIDHFCFDLAVDCLNEFRHSRQHSFLPDLTYGKESAPVQVVNAFDYEYPPYVEYSSQRIAGSGVHLNTDDEFLVGCDCEDDCRDKTKCRCWQTTYSGISFTKLSNPLYPVKGYEYRRLKDHIVSGIYECNPKCKCAKTCCNRVAQNGLKVPLQVFKTAAKGWGIRPIFDVPEGAFICIYAGQVLTDAGANEDGQQFGDEYLAELDYIESIEGVKADYESDVTDIETEEPGERSKKRIKTKKATTDKGDEESDQEVDFHAADASYHGPKPSTVERTVSTRGKHNGKTSSASGSSKNSDSDDEGEGGARPRSHFNANVDTPKAKVTNRRPLREYFGENEECYIMDAKTTGNIGRYLNHSCQPNVFVQNVFVDTHDLRFPWVSFFASKHIRAGSELTWDYNYEIGSVPNKVLFCYCGSPDCRGRLL
ncbi:histone-lysine N-methyltransferase eggless isoform X1 [Folsomia candida]|nr:histone-lysine N-methyltransferase eggless isoform X1 [Folsomia candida]